MANLVFPFIGFVARIVKANFVRQTRRTDRVQADFLWKLLHEYRHTALGREYNLGEIRTIDQFRDRVPVLPYSGYESYIDRICQGEPNVLTPDPVAYLNLTSGSTGDRKLIPVTQRFQQILGGANLTSIGFLNEALAARGLTFGKLLIANSVQVQGCTSGGIPYGYASVGVLRMGKFLYEQLFANCFETLLCSDSRSRHYLALLFALRERSTAGIAANFPMLVLRTCHYLEEYGEELIRDIDKGTIASWLELDPSVRDRLECQWSADPQRAGELRAIMRSRGRLTPKDVWSNLAFIGTARGGTSDFYFENFPEYLGNTPVFGAVYSSAEATFSIYPDVNTDGSILAINSGFFEFVPEDQWGLEHPQTRLATEVEVGKYYRLLVTTYSGLYRYDIGDVVEVVGFFEQAPLIVFRYRRGGLLSSTTEKTNEYHVTQVMQALQHEFGLPLEDFCVTLANEAIPAHYLVNVEIAEGHQLDDPQEFLAQFDRKLQAANASYALKRPSNYIPPPRLRILKPGSFAIVRQRQLERGIPDSQLKFPHISEDRQFLAGLSVEREIHLPGD